MTKGEYTMKGRYDFKFRKPNIICSECIYLDVCKDLCAAISSIADMIELSDDIKKHEQLAYFKPEIVTDYCETNDDLEILANKIIDKFDRFTFIRDLDISVGYVMSTEKKMKSRNFVYGQCEKISKELKAYLPFDFVITIYEPNYDTLSENQQKVVMLHELQHIEMGDRGLKIREHDIQDFSNILYKHGINWNDWSDDDVDIEDILEEGGK
jgi:predicted metallopeptidase